MPLKTVPYTASVPYEEIETYYETHIESYTEREPYEKPIPLSYVVTRVDVVIPSRYDPYHEISVSIRNTDTAGGIFKVEFYITSEAGGEITGHASKYIAAGDTGMVEIQFDVRLLVDYEYCVTPPTKTAIEYRYVEKTRRMSVPTERAVTKYREQPRYKEVTVLDYLLHY